MIPWDRSHPTGLSVIHIWPIKVMSASGHSNWLRSGHVTQNEPRLHPEFMLELIGKKLLPLSPSDSRQVGDMSSEFLEVIFNPHERSTYLNRMPNDRANNEKP